MIETNVYEKINQLVKNNDFQRFMIKQIIEVFNIAKGQLPNQQFIKRLSHRILQIFNQQGNHFLGYLRHPKFLKLQTSTIQKLNELFKSIDKQHQQALKQQFTGQLVKQLQVLIPKFANIQQIEQYHLKLFASYKQFSFQQLINPLKPTKNNLIIDQKQQFFNTMNQNMGQVLLQKQLLQRKLISPQQNIYYQQLQGNYPHYKEIIQQQNVKNYQRQKAKNYQRQKSKNYQQNVKNCQQSSLQQVNLPQKMTSLANVAQKTIRQENVRQKTINDKQQIVSCGQKLINPISTLLNSQKQIFQQQNALKIQYQYQQNFLRSNQSQISRLNLINSHLDLSPNYKYPIYDKDKIQGYAFKDYQHEQDLFTGKDDQLVNRLSQFMFIQCFCQGNYNIQYTYFVCKLCNFYFHNECLQLDQTQIVQVCPCCKLKESNSIFVKIHSEPIFKKWYQFNPYKKFIFSSTEREIQTLKQTKLQCKQGSTQQYQLRFLKLNKSRNQKQKQQGKPKFNSLVLPSEFIDSLNPMKQFEINLQFTKMEYQRLAQQNQKIFCSFFLIEIYDLTQMAQQFFANLTQINSVGKSYVQNFANQNQKGQIKINMIDKEIQQFITYPVRGNLCQHPQPFDYLTALQYCKENGKFICTICNQNCENIIGDQFLWTQWNKMQEKQKQQSEQYTHFIYRKDGTFQFTRNYQQSNSSHNQKLQIQQQTIKKETAK